MAVVLGLSPKCIGSNPIGSTNAEVANGELVEPLALEASNLASSSLALGTMDGLSMVRQLVLKTRIRCNSRGFDTSALRNGIDSLEKTGL